VGSGLQADPIAMPRIVPPGAVAIVGIGVYAAYRNEHPDFVRLGASRRVRKFRSLGSQRELRLLLVLVDSGDQVVEVLAGEGPLERSGDLSVVVAKRE
jgi:hypothetical protein